MKKSNLVCLLCLSLVAVAVVVGCQKATQPASNAPPTFVLSWSEYPSWSVFGVANEKGIIDGGQGMSPLEKKWNVNVILKEADYDTCLTQFGSSTVDASCITNLDILSQSLGRPAVAIMPTSTSVGGDALILTSKVKDLDDLKNYPIYGLEKSVSQYVFNMNLILAGKNPKDYTFKNMDPAAAAQAMQTKQSEVNAIMVWNPFVLQTLRSRDDVRSGFDSSTIPEHVIDCVMVGKDALEKEGGDRFASCVIEAYYKVNQLIDAPESRNDTLVALGAKFSNLGAEDMALVCKQTRFYNTPAKAVKLFTSQEFRTKTMPEVVDFCVKEGIVPSDNATGAARFGFENQDALLNFTTKYLNEVTAY